jgi:hypothetical protein
VLQVICQTKFDQCFQQGIPDALLSPSSEPDIDRVPFAISLVHVAPRAADPQHMHHAIEKPPIILRGPGLSPALQRQQSPNDIPIDIRKITTSQIRLLKGSLESQIS